MSNDDYDELDFTMKIFHSIPEIILIEMYEGYKKGKHRAAEEIVVQAAHDAPIYDRDNLPPVCMPIHRFLYERFPNIPAIYSSSEEVISSLINQNPVLINDLITAIERLLDEYLAGPMPELMDSDHFYHHFSPEYLRLFFQLAVDVGCIERDKFPMKRMENLISKFRREQFGYGNFCWFRYYFHTYFDQLEIQYESISSSPEEK